MNDAFIINGLDSDRYDGSTVRFTIGGEMFYSPATISGSPQVGVLSLMRLQKAPIITSWASPGPILN